MNGFAQRRSTHKPKESAYDRRMRRHRHLAKELGIHTNQVLEVLLAYVRERAVEAPDTVLLASMNYGLDQLAKTWTEMRILLRISDEKLTVRLGELTTALKAFHREYINP